MCTQGSGALTQGVCTKGNRTLTFTGCVYPREGLEKEQVLVDTVGQRSAHFALPPGSNFLREIYASYCLPVNSVL